MRRASHSNVLGGPCWVHLLAELRLHLMQSVTLFFRHGTADAHHSLESIFGWLLSRHQRGRRQLVRPAAVRRHPDLHGAGGPDRGRLCGGRAAAARQGCRLRGALPGRGRHGHHRHLGVGRRSSHLNSPSMHVAVCLRCACVCGVAGSGHHCLLGAGCQCSRHSPAGLMRLGDGLRVRGLLAQSHSPVALPGRAASCAAGRPWQL